MKDLLVPRVITAKNECGDAECGAIIICGDEIITYKDSFLVFLDRFTLQEVKRIDHYRPLANACLRLSNDNKKLCVIATGMINTVDVVNKTIDGRMAGGLMKPCYSCIHGCGFLKGDDRICVFHHGGYVIYNANGLAVLANVPSRFQMPCVMFSKADLSCMLILEHSSLYKWNIDENKLVAEAILPPDNKAISFVGDDMCVVATHDPKDLKIVDVMGYDIYTLAESSIPQLANVNMRHAKNVGDGRHIVSLNYYEGIAEYYIIDMLTGRRQAFPCGDKGGNFALSDIVATGGRDLYLRYNKKTIQRLEIAPPFACKLLTGFLDRKNYLIAHELYSDGMIMKLECFTGHQKRSICTQITANGAINKINEDGIMLCSPMNPNSTRSRSKWMQFVPLDGDRQNWFEHMVAIRAQLKLPEAERLHGPDIMLHYRFDYMQVARHHAGIFGLRVPKHVMELIYNFMKK